MKADPVNLGSCVTSDNGTWFQLFCQTPCFINRYATAPEDEESVRSEGGKSDESVTSDVRRQVLLFFRTVIPKRGNKIAERDK